MMSPELSRDQELAAMVKLAIELKDAKRPQGSRDFYSRANHASLPVRASGMLAVCYELKVVGVIV